MEIVFSPAAWEDYLYWQEHDERVLDKVNRLIAETRRAPFEGIGKPEPLKQSLRGFWSRRITGEHRFVYRVEGGRLQIVQLRWHY